MTFLNQTLRFADNHCGDNIGGKLFTLLFDLFPNWGWYSGFPSLPQEGLDEWREYAKSRLLNYFILVRLELPSPILIHCVLTQKVLVINKLRGKEFQLMGKTTELDSNLGKLKPFPVDLGLHSDSWAWSWDFSCITHSRCIIIKSKVFFNAWTFLWGDQCLDINMSLSLCFYVISSVSEIFRESSEGRS